MADQEQQQAAPGPNAQALQQLVARNELQDEAQRVGLCDGEDPLAVRKYMEEMNFVPDELKLSVIRRTARGSFRREFEDYLQEHTAQHAGNLPAWAEVRRHLLNSFVALDIDEARRSELEKLRQQSGESLVHFNRRFKTLMDEAYSDQAGVPDTHKILIRLYGRGLLARKMEEYMMAPGPPCFSAVQKRKPETPTAS